MKNRFFSVGIFIAAVLLVSGCSSEETPSELENLINQLQTSQITSETVPEETSEDTEEEKTEASTTPDNTDEPSVDTVVTENSDETTEAVSTPDDTEETTDISEENSDNPTVYDSITVKVLSVDEDHISVESGGTVYDISITEDTPVLGGTVLEGKVITITYIVNDDGTQTDIAVAVITVLPDN